MGMVWRGPRLSFLSFLPASHLLFPKVAVPFTLSRVSLWMVPLFSSVPYLSNACNRMTEHTRSTCLFPLSEEKEPSGQAVWSNSLDFLAGR